jgi:hypothetical protein
MFCLNQGYSNNFNSPRSEHGFDFLEVEEYEVFLHCHSHLFGHLCRWKTTTGASSLKKFTQVNFTELPNKLGACCCQTLNIFCV